MDHQPSVDLAMSVCDLAMSVCLPICLNAQLSETIKVRMLRLSIPILEILAQFKIFSAGFYPLYNAHKPPKQRPQTAKTLRPQTAQACLLR